MARGVREFDLYFKSFSAGKPLTRGARPLILDHGGLSCSLVLCFVKSKAFIY